MASGIWHLACQTYALNLIDSHSGQNRAPQLFSSPKSFRVAKSTPSSAKSSAKLPPISKWLLKPPLLFKSPLLRKSALFFAPLLLLSYTQGVQALSAQTSNVIRGSAPYFTFDGGVTKLTDTDSLLSIKLPDGRVYTRSTNPSTPTNPIRLPNWRGTFNDIEMIVPPPRSNSISRSSITMNDLVSQGYWGDDDGDGQGVGGVTASGSISVEFRNRNGYTVHSALGPNLCSAPYKVTLTSSDGTLSTQYGVPRSSSFSRATVDYYITPYEYTSICWARPNLLYGGATDIDSSDNYRHAGPFGMWNSSQGFYLQSTSPSSYDGNFPTTGADGLYFDLEIPTGIDGSQLSWTVNTSGSLSATVSWTRPRYGTFTSSDNRTIEADKWITDKSKYVTRVTLHGPRASSSQIGSSNPSPLTRPSLPQTFELVGRDRSGNDVRYGFVLKQWFVNRGNRQDTPSNHTAWCNSLGYRMVRVRDLTNAVCSGWNMNNGYPCTGAVGATPSSGNNVYKRYIGAGLFTEWGHMRYYADADFGSYHYPTYWTSDATGSYQFSVYSSNGGVSSFNTSDRRWGLCTAP
ncbi:MULTISPECIES: hypothetical protein [unclassified Gilliamella]|uniref:hypothetical protein n=1 Tax=unclassified Gilliamella TaxID=2685620 RepID=UPI0013256CC8|nr:MULTISPECIES: hypothetical protein [unclassified Gilliamella]MWN32470.1 hypothetical protein [Gilliamella sp. Pra-s60]MWP29968.1 hypothetical protein [Gilliamella sp. Pra-s54]